MNNLRYSDEKIEASYLAVDIKKARDMKKKNKKNFVSIL